MLLHAKKACCTRTWPSSAPPPSPWAWPARRRSSTQVSRPSDAWTHIVPQRVFGHFFRIYASINSAYHFHSLTIGFSLAGGHPKSLRVLFFAFFQMAIAPEPLNRFARFEHQKDQLGRARLTDCPDPRTLSDIFGHSTFF
jgi:hypothetical protein